MMLAYIGPETTLPVLSVVAAVGGVFMMLGRNTFRFFGRLLRFKKD